MNTKLEELSFKLNSFSSAAGATFDAVVSAEGDTLEVTSSEAPDFPIYVTATDHQILSVTPLFKIDAIHDGEVDKINKVALELGPVIPLSSIGLQGDTYILYGAMAIGTTFENIAHELEIQANSTNEVLDALEEFLA